MNHKRVERIWRREGLKIPQKQAKKGRLWLGDGSCVRLRPERPNHVWSHDFVQDRTHDGRVFRTLDIIDEYTREALMIRVDRKLNSTDVLDALTDLFMPHAGRRNTSDPTMAPSSSPRGSGTGSGPLSADCCAIACRAMVGAKTAFIEPGSPWENGCCESFNARFRDELLNAEVFCSLREAQILIDNWRRHYNTVRPHFAALPTSGTRGLRPDRPETNDALTIHPDHSMGAVQSNTQLDPRTRYLPALIT